MKRLLLLLLGLFTFSAHAEAHSEKGAFVVVPPCGIASAYGAFINLGMDISLNNITQRYQELFPDEDSRVMPLSHLSALIQSFGLHTLAIQGDLAALDYSMLPAILCIVNASDGVPLPVGHVVLKRYQKLFVSSIKSYDSKKSYSLCRCSCACDYHIVAHRVPSVPS